MKTHKIWFHMQTSVCATILVCLCGCVTREIREITDSTRAQPFGGQEDLKHLDLNKYDVVTIVPFTLENTANVDSSSGQKLAANIFGRVKHDFPNLFSQINFGSPTGKPNELIVTGVVKSLAVGNANEGAGLLWRHLSKLAVSVTFRDAATQQTVFTTDVSGNGGLENSNLDDVLMAMSTRVANTLARGRGWQP